jgi:hypothetical protein
LRFQSITYGIAYLYGLQRVLALKVLVGVWHQDTVEELLSKQAAESLCWDTLHYDEALHKVVKTLVSQTTSSNQEYMHSHSSVCSSLTVLHATLFVGFSSWLILSSSSHLHIPSFLSSCQLPVN